MFETHEKREVFCLFQFVGIMLVMFASLYVWGRLKKRYISIFLYLQVPPSLVLTRQLERLNIKTFASEARVFRHVSERPQAGTIKPICIFLKPRYSYSTILNWNIIYFIELLSLGIFPMNELKNDKGTTFFNGISRAS